MRTRTWGRTLLAVVAVVAAGCATGKVAYEKAGTTEAERKRDVAECVHASLGHEVGRHALMVIEIDRNAVTQCLEGRGYTRARQ